MKLRTEITFELEVWPSRKRWDPKKGPREGNTGLGVYHSLRDVEQAMKRVQRGRKTKVEFRVWLVCTDRELMKLAPEKKAKKSKK